MVRLAAFLRGCNASEGEAGLEPAGGALDVFASLGDGAEADAGDGTRAVADEIQSLEKYLLATERRLFGERAECDAAKEAALGKLEAGVMRGVSGRVRAALADGLTLFQKLQKSILLPTGLPGLDRLLAGGLREGQITEFFGASPSGKTQVCHCVAACGAWLEFGVVYLTSNASFSAERLIQLSRHVLKDQFGPTNEELVGNLGKLLTNVSVHQPRDTLSLIAVLQTFLERFDSMQRHGLGDAVPKVLIVDSPSLLLYRDLSINMGFGKLLMVQLSSVLSCLAAKHDMFVVLTNHEVHSLHSSAAVGGMSGGGGSGSGVNTRHGLGVTWGNTCNVRVHLKQLQQGQQQQQGQHVQATLVKSSNQATGKQEAFKLM